METGRLIAVLATFAVGAIVALQPPVNSELGKQTTVLVAAFVGTALAAAALGVLVLFAGEAGAVGKAWGVNPLYLTGGLMGALLITVSLVTVRTLGAGGVVAATVCGAARRLSGARPRRRPRARGHRADARAPPRLRPAHRRDAARRPALSRRSASGRRRAGMR